MTKQRGKLIVFMDGECALCRVTSSVLDTTDRAGTAEVVDFREDNRYGDHGISEDAATARIQVIDTTTGNIYEGFTAIRAIAREVPLLWPLRPLLALLALLRLGDPLYDLIAKHRPRRTQPKAPSLRRAKHPSPSRWRGVG
jgi:predicted DCC family thiol-disulfide oxidoreductase YuxK